MQGQSTTRKRRRPEGIEPLHGRRCRSRKENGGGRCNCQPSYRATVFVARDGSRIRKTFGELQAARDWRAEATTALRKGKLSTPSRELLRDAATRWLDDAEAGRVRARGGDPYKPSAIRSYRDAPERRIVPELGAHKLADLRRKDVQRFADRLLGDGLDPSTVRNALMPLRAIYRRALRDGDVSVNPTTGLELQAVRGRRDRIASPDEAARLIAALPALSDRAMLGTAFYAGLRLGELRALRWGDVDLAAGVIRVERAMDGKGSVIAPKSEAGRRAVPIVGVLRDLLIEWRMDCAWSDEPDGYVFGVRRFDPFDESAARRRRLTGWKRANAEEAERAEEEGREPELVEPIGLHEARHVCASIMIAAGVNVKALSTYLGHSSITITLDRYGHLMPGNEAEATSLIDDYLARAAGGTLAPSERPQEAFSRSKTEGGE